MAAAAVDGPALDDRKVRVLVAQPESEFAALLRGGAAGGKNLDTVQGKITEITDLRVTFKVEKNLGKGPNGAQVSIFNLSASTRAALQQKGALLVVQAGYPGNVATIFKGDIRTIEHLHEDGMNWETKIKAGDGDRAYLFARCGENFPPGVKMPEVVKIVASKMGLELPDFDKISGMAALQFANGYVAVGRASKEMDRILQSAGYEWSIQDGRLQVLKKGETPKQQVIVLSSDSGLIGSPEYCAPEKKGKAPILKFKSLLSPQIFPGGLLAFASLRHKGIHTVKKAEHTGDTDGGPWFTDGEVEVAEAAVAV